MTLVGDRPRSPSAASLDAATADGVERRLARRGAADGPGCCVAVIREGTPVLECCHGLASIELGVALTATSTFDIASMSKQFTAAATLLLAGAGDIGLDDEVQAYVPELPEYSWPVTVRQLVHHTSGVRDYLGLRHVAGEREGAYFDMADVLELVTRQRGLNFEPGTRHLYSNSGYVLLAVIVSRVTGVSLGEWCRTHLFEPLGMTSTRFREDVFALVPNLVQGYHRDAQEALRKELPHDDVVGDGGLLSTLRDLELWEGNYVEERVGGPGFTARMATPGTPEGDSERYAFGLSVGEHRGRRTVSHGGNLAGFSGEFLRFPDEALTVVCMGNLGTFDAAGVAREVADLVLGGAGEAETPDAAAPAAEGDAAEATAPAAGPPDGLEGLYRVSETGMVIEVLGEDAGLVAVAADTRILLTHREGARFAGQYHDLVLDVEIGPGGTGLDELRLIHLGEALLTAERIEAPVLDTGALAAYTGAYWSDELALEAQVVTEDGGLHLRRGSAPREALRPTLTDEFATSFGGVRFLRDARQAVDGFTISMSRATGVAFARRPDAHS